MGSNFVIVHLLLACIVVGFAAAQEPSVNEVTFRCIPVQASESFNFSCTFFRNGVDVTDNVTFTCSIDGGMEEPCSDPVSFDSTSIGEGRHNITITAAVDKVTISESRTRVFCGNLPAPENGFIDVSGTIDHTTAEYSCESGYVLSGGDRERVCQLLSSEPDGEWSGVAPTCVFDCGTLMNPENGQVNFIIGGNATYTCDEGFSLEGVDTRTCMADGQWSDSEPTCVTCMADHGERSDSDPTCGTEAAQFSLLVVTLLVIVGLTIVWV